MNSLFEMDSFGMQLITTLQSDQVATSASQFVSHVDQSFMVRLASPEECFSVKQQVTGAFDMDMDMSAPLFSPESWQA